MSFRIFKDTFKVNKEEEQWDGTPVDWEDTEVKVKEFKEELKELFIKHQVDLINYDQYDHFLAENPVYLRTDIFPVLAGHPWYGDTLHDILEEVLNEIYDAADNTGSN